MKAGIVVAVLGALVAIATGDVSMMLTQDQHAALTTIDTVPSKADLQGNQLVVPDDLVTIAANTAQKYEPGVRIRAIHGLLIYCVTPGTTCPDGSSAHDALADLLTTNGGALSGADLLVLRAAIESLGPLRVTTDLTPIASLLNHPSRDIRAAAARALAAMCDTGAITPLRVRYQNESTDQVKLAISAALRSLPCP